MGIIGIYEGLIDSHDMRTSGNLRDNRGKRSDTGLLDNPGLEYAPDDALMNEFLIELYLAFGM